MEPFIRPARAEDAPHAAPLIFTSGPDAFNYVFSHRTRVNAVGFLEYAFACGHGEFSWPVHWVVELDGAIVGTAAGYTGATAKGFMWPAIRQIMHCNGFLAGMGVIGRGLRIERIIVPPSRPDMFYIGNVAVAPPLQGKGIGQLIFSHLHEEARRQGASVAALDVSAENPRAEALYTRLGYRVVKENVSNLGNAAGRVVNHRRMERDLAPENP